jgi:hypothetical protein
MEQVEIRIKGQINQNWSDWLGGLSINYKQTDTVLTGSIPDQAALYGLLLRLSDMGVQLVSLNSTIVGQGKNRDAKPK